jgi:hypothetical protein
MAKTYRDHLSVPIEQPVEPLLPEATRVTIRLADREASVQVERGRMRKLLKAVNRCRSGLGSG